MSFVSTFIQFFATVSAEYESKLMGFVDDVEFLFSPDKNTVEYRSASRLGEGDFDANRKRIRDFRVALQDKVSFYLFVYTDIPVSSTMHISSAAS